MAHFTSLSFTVQGRPAQMGSKRAFVRHGRAVMVNDNSDRLRQWYNAVASAAAEAMKGELPMEGPLCLSIRFFFKRPKAHFGTGKNAGVRKVDSPDRHIQKPDLDKLIRCTQDALSTVVWRDDCQVCRFGKMSRDWAEFGGERAELLIQAIDSLEAF